MKHTVKFEIKGKDEFWTRAFHVEWEDQFPNRKLTVDQIGNVAAENDWLDDLERVAGQTFCRILRSPENPQRRQWMNSLLAKRGSL